MSTNEPAVNFTFSTPEVKVEEPKLNPHPLGDGHNVFDIIKADEFKSLIKGLVEEVLNERQK